MAEEPRCTTVYFDGACPVCSREIAHYRTRPGADALQFVDVSGDARMEPDLDRDAALKRMHVRMADGSLRDGAAAFAAIWQALPGWRWLGRMASWPVVAPLLELGYRGFLATRPLWRKPQP